MVIKSGKLIISAASFAFHISPVYRHPGLVSFSLLLVTWWGGGGAHKCLQHVTRILQISAPSSSKNDGDKTIPALDVRWNSWELPKGVDDSFRQNFKVNSLSNKQD